MILYSIDVYQAHSPPKKKDLKIPPTTLVLKYICNFKTLLRVLFCNKYIPYIQVLQCSLEFFYIKFITLSLKLMKYTFDKPNQSKMWHLYVTIFFIIKILYLWLQFLGGFSVFSSSIQPL
jgi:hypothetical protein